MPVSRSGMRHQVIRNLSAVAPPGEQFIACVHGESGVSPYLIMAFDSAILEFVVALIRKRYYITMTNGNFIVNKASRNMNRVKDIVCVVPIGAAPLVNVKQGWFLWSKLWFQFPGRSKPTKIYFRRFWNSDVSRMLEALQQMGYGAQSAVGYGQVPSQFPGQYQPPQQSGYPQAPYDSQPGYTLPLPDQYPPQQPGQYHQ
jgi:hypothetical protein